MMLERLAAVSAALAATRSRKEKTRLLAELLRELAPDERETAVAWLAGVLPGGKLSLGPAAVYAAQAPAALEATLTIGAAALALEELRGIAGKGSARKREQVLASLFAAATTLERARYQLHKVSSSSLRIPSLPDRTKFVLADVDRFHRNVVHWKSPAIDYERMRVAIIRKQ
jgi:DNA ligase-1